MRSTLMRAMIIIVLLELGQYLPQVPFVVDQYPIGPYGAHPALGVFRYTDTWPAAAHLVASGRVDLDSLVTGRFCLEQAGDALNADRTPGSLKSVVVPA